MKTTMQHGAKSSAMLDPNWKPLLECAVVEVFEMMAGVRLETNSEAPGEPRGEYTAMVGLAGALCGMVTLRCSTAATTKFASLMLGGDAASAGSAAQDALGELSNMVAGNFKAKISGLADGCMLSVPTVICGEDYSMSALEPTDGIMVCFRFDAEPIWVSLISHS
jgi:chemotaxis protein CheX